MSRDLLVTVHTPRLGTGRALRTYGVARALAAAGRGLDLVYAVFGGEEPDEAFAGIPGVELHPVRPSRGAGRALAYARARLAGVPKGFARGISPELPEAAAALAQAPGRGRVVADGPVAAAALRRLPGVVYCAHNLESGGFRGRALGSPRALARFERGLLARAAESWMVSDADLEGARTLCKGARLRYVPNVVDTDAIVPGAGGRPGGPFLMVADFSYPPNRHGYEWLAREVMPLVWDAVPAARLLVAGRGLEEPAPDERIEILGFVADLEPRYAEAACAVVPLLEGGGSPLKFVEALAHGLPVVATPVAARGLEAEAGVHYLAGEDAAGLAEALRRTATEGAPDVAARGRGLAEQRYSIAALTELLAA